MHQLVPHFILEHDAAGRTGGNFQAAGLFVDISGFSALTDSLMLHGHHGAEVLAHVMRAVFSPLIAAVVEKGGFIANQAGDAFTALFPASSDLDQACRRALAAAAEIQGHVAAHPLYETPYGNYAISVKVGLSAGEVSWGILHSQDGRRATYYFRGDVIDGCAEAQNQAHAGEILVDPAFAGCAGTHFAAEGAGDWQRVTAVFGPAPQKQVLAPPKVQPEQMYRFFPKEIVEQRTGGEFRQVVSVFVSLPTLRTETQLSIFMEYLYTQLDRFGGLLQQLSFGDKGAHLLLFWGTPVAFENDVQRALDFILELQERTTIPINGGITYRVAHLGFIGSDLHEEFTAYGEGINLAARFMTKATRGEIWIDEHVARKAQSRFDIEPVGEMAFKGFALPQKVFTLYERHEQPEPSYTGELVGREAEQAALSEFLEPVFTDNLPTLIAVEGEAGIGKSRLVHEYLKELEQKRPGAFQVFLGQTDQVHQLSLNPFRYWLRHYFQVNETQGEARNKRSFNRKLDDLVAATTDRRLAGELDRTRSLLGALVDLHWPDSLYEQLDASGRYENTFIALASLLRAESLQKPVIFFLEDVHWLDDDSDAFLHQIFRTLYADARFTYPIGFILTSRLNGWNFPFGDCHCSPIELSPLGRQSMAALFEAEAGAPARPALLNLLERRAGGNPFFATQIIHYLREEGYLVEQEGGWTVKDEQVVLLPGDVRAVLVARLDRLPKDVKEVVQTASILGREFDERVLAAILEDNPRLPTLIDQAEQETIWAKLGETHYIFHHALLRDAAYGMQLLAQRQALHALAVTAYERVYEGQLASQYGILAFHAENAGQIEEAVKYLHLAAQEAIEVYQNSTAVGFTDRALALLPEDDVELRYELLILRDTAFTRLGKPPERQQNLDRIRDLVLRLQDRRRTAEMFMLQAGLDMDTGNFPGAIANAEQSIAFARLVEEDRAFLPAYLILAMALLRQDQPEEAMTILVEGRDLATRLGDLVSESRMLNSMGMVAIEQRDLPLAHQVLARSLQAARDSGNQSILPLPLNSLGMLAGYIGDLVEARDYYEQSLQISRQVGLRKGEGITLGNLGYVAGCMGDFSSALQYTEQNIQIAREVGAPYDEAYGQINLSPIWIAKGDLQAAVHAAEEGLRLARQIGERNGEAWALTNLGHSRFALGQLREAGEAYQAALTIRTELDQSLLATEPQAGLARVALAAGDQHAAQSHVEPILAYLQQDSSLSGTDEPLRVYLACFKVLDECGDPRASEILDKAHALLLKRAERISDAEARRAFLEEIPHHRAILEARQQ